MKTVQINEQELYEINYKIINNSFGIRHFGDRAIREETARHFKLLTAMQKKRAAWIHSNANKLIVFAFVSFVALTIKISCEAFWGMK